MAGIYIHIPFCRQACHYCDFHFSTNLRLKEDMLEQINHEITSRKDYLSEAVDTIYFGGGTPSLLDAGEIHSLLVNIRSNFEVSESPEITLEANPEDLDLEKCRELQTTEINRLSIGIQTFNDGQLRWMNRVHDADQARQAMVHARAAGFRNVSLDLIYALPEHGLRAWESDLEKVVKLNPEHVSLYGLTIESRTVFGNWQKKGKLQEVAEEEAAQQYLAAIKFLHGHGYQQYEVSNFGKTGLYSRHNNGYWQGIPYLGVGPGAHSFDGKSRRFNVRSNPIYVKNGKAGTPSFEEELLSDIQIINERIMTSLRTREGLDLEEIEKKTNQPFLPKHQQLIDQLESNQMIRIESNRLSLLPLGFLVADEIALQLFFEE